MLERIERGAGNAVRPLALKCPTDPGPGGIPGGVGRTGATRTTPYACTHRLNAGRCLIVPFHVVDRRAVAQPTKPFLFARTSKFLELSKAVSRSRQLSRDDHATMPGDRSREYRRLAAECLALARGSSDSRVRASLLSMAQNWLDLAELPERNAYSLSLRYRAIQAAIGAELRFMYGLPHSLPPHFLALLAQLNAENHSEG
jgi:hypothetical protein